MVWVAVFQKTLLYVSSEGTLKMDTKLDCTDDAGSRNGVRKNCISPQRRNFVCVCVCE